MESERLIRAFERCGLDGSLAAGDGLQYERSRRVWNGLINRRPGVIVGAQSVGDVRRTVSVAAEEGCLIAVRCGGHSFPGFSTCDGGP